MKLWDKGFRIDDLIESFTIGKDRDLDLYLAKYDVLGSKAHAEMLCEIKMISKLENDQLQGELDNILALIEDGKFYIDPGIEDVHSQVEYLLTGRLGSTGKKIHLGRSRNDQVLVDLRLFYRDKLDEIVDASADLVDILLDQADKYKEILMPGYTHMQVAMVSSFGLWFSCFAESLIDDIQNILSTRTLLNRNPLGTAAGYGSSIPLDRQSTTEKLDFDGLCINPLNAQLGRGKIEFQIANAMAAIGITLNKLASDVCLYSNENHRFLGLPKEFTTGSSIMPHKKNPDVFELIRAQSNMLMVLPAQVSHCINNLPSGYHRDFQLLKEVIFPGFSSCLQLLSLLIHCMPNLKVAPTVVFDNKYQYLFTVESVNDYVKKGLSFREAYGKVAKEIEEGKYRAKGAIKHTHLGSIGNLGLGEMKKRLNALLGTQQNQHGPD